MAAEGPAGDSPSRSKRADAQRNRETVLTAAAEVFVTSGVDAPIRQIAARAGVGMATIYRHFPTRADLVTAVYQHQIEACAEAATRTCWPSPPPRSTHCANGSTSSSTFSSPNTASPTPCSRTATASPRCTPTSSTACCPFARSCSTPRSRPHEIRPGTQPYELMRGIGNLCIGRDNDPRYDPRRLIALLLQGLQRPQES